LRLIRRGLRACLLFRALFFSPREIARPCRGIVLDAACRPPGVSDVHHTALSISFQNVAPQQGSPGVAVPDAPDSSGGSGGGQPPGSMLTMLLPFLMIVPFLFLMFRRNKKEAEQRAKLKKGDRIVSQSGLVGELMDMDERFAKVKIAPGTTVQMLLTSISPLDTAPAATQSDKDLKDLKDAKAATDKK
jgi:preprotein translocase subunit YajC